MTTVFDFADVLQRALDVGGNTHTLADLNDEVESGRMMLWPGERSALVTWIEKAPRKTVLHLAFIGGELPEIARMLPHVFAWARRQGCDMVCAMGRRGWARLAESHTDVRWTFTGVMLHGTLRPED